VTPLTRFSATFTSWQAKGKGTVLNFAIGASYAHPYTQPDLTKARRIGTDPRRVDVDFPDWMVGSLDREARRVGVTRPSLIKLWLADL